MFNYTRYKSLIIAALVICICLFTCIVTEAQVALKVVYPFIGGNKIEVKWDPVANAQEYAYRRKVNTGAYSAWKSVALNTTYTDMGLSAASIYFYQVRVKVAGIWSAPSNEKGNGFKRVWPVRKTSDGVTESRELLHGFGQPIEAGAKKYFHEGIDIHGESSVDNEVVRAPAGGIILQNGGAGTNIYVALQVSIDGNTRYMLFNHLQKNNTNLMVGESVMVGDSLGVIIGDRAVWNVLTSHTHCQFYTDAVDFITTALNPLTFWDKDEHRDPQKKNPEVANTNADADAVRFRKTPGTSDYFPNDGKVHNGVDVVAESIDKQSSDAPWQVPRVVGYYIQMQEKGNWKDVVKTSAAPYILVDNNIYYESHSGSPNPKVINTIIDYRDDLKSKPPHTPADYQFAQWFTYIITNTKGIAGAIADLDSNQHWATDARKTVAPANGYVNNYAKARAIDEAKFPDGRYRVNIRLSDFVNTSSDFKREILVDNFRPQVRKVEMKAGKMNYVASWKWNEAFGRLELTDNKDTGKACGKVTIKITTSEPMKDVKLEIPTLTFSKNSTSPVPDTDSTVWEFEIPAEKIKDSAEGPHRLFIGGHDISGTVLQGFTSKGNVRTSAIHKRKLDGTWVPATAPSRDTIHSFKILNLKNKITVKTTAVTACNKSDGKATISVTGVAGTFEYAVDAGAYQASGAFTNLAKGKHTAKVRIKETGCEFSKEFTIDAPKEVCNRIDDDCDGQIDEGVQLVFYHDADGDSYGNSEDTTHACSVPPGYVSNDEDCNDNNAYVYPVAGECIYNAGVENFTLVNADTENDIQPLYDGSIIDLNSLPEHLNIRANTTPPRVGSVVFTFNGRRGRTEEGFPYALGGDYPKGDYHSFTLSAGGHTLTATPYEKHGGTGIMGNPLTIHFTVVGSIIKARTSLYSSGSSAVNSNASAEAAKQQADFNKLSDLSKSSLGLKINPNPANNILDIYTTGLQRNKRIIISVLSPSGMIMKIKQSAGTGQVVQLNVSSLLSGVYTIKVISGDKVLYKQFVKL